MTSARSSTNVAVVLTVPARPEYLRLVRLAAADGGARASLTIEEIEDLRIAVDELAYAVIGTGDGDGELTLEYVASVGSVEVAASCTAPTGSAELSDLSRTIISAVADEFTIADEGGARRFSLTKRSRE